MRLPIGRANHQDDADECQLGLPTHGTAVENLIKPMNRLSKGTEPTRKERAVEADCRCERRP
jgi:hypothetical protein